jgi:hypothetical protein
MGPVRSLVSHWSVDSAATVKLITSAVGTITRDPRIGPAEAGDPRQSHPAFWASVRRGG